MKMKSFLVELHHSPGSLAKRLRYTLSMLSGLLLVSLLANTTFESITHFWLNHTGFSAIDFWYWRFARMITSALVTSGGPVFWEAMFFVAFAVGLAEWITGWKRTAATFWGLHILVLILSSLIISLALHQLRAFGIEVSEVARDVGPSAGYFACLGLVSARIKHPWNLYSGAVLFTIFVTAIFLPADGGGSAALKFSADLAHVLAFPLGWFSARIGNK